MDSIKQQQYFDFLKEYVEFFKSMAAFEKQKLDMLLSGELAQIEHSIAAAQANMKQLENIETKRIFLQEQAGFAHLTLKQVAERAGEQHYAPLTELYQRLSSYIDDMKFYNLKSMEVAQTNLKKLSSASAASEKVTYAKNEQKEEAARPSLWQAKV